MTDTREDGKWFYRCILLLTISTLSYVVFQPSYNFAHWLPHSFLRGLGVPYSALLYFETHADKLLHPLGAAFMTVLWHLSKVPFFLSKLKTLCVIFIALFSTEIIQAIIGRGFDSIDLILGTFGCCLAYLTIPNK